MQNNKHKEKKDMQLKIEQLKDIVSKNIIYLRINSKLTQLELGEKLSYSDKTVSKWERGEAIPDAYVLKQLSNLFEVSVDYLLSPHDNDELKKNTPKHKFYLSSRTIIMLISFLGTYTIGLFAFVCSWLAGYFFWQILIYAIPFSFLVLIILTAVIGKRIANVLFISAFVWSVFVSLYVLFLSHNWWLLFLLGIPAQIIILLSFMIRKKSNNKID